ncbi:MAG TPA: hypothetical protein VF301_11020 [Ginsengibacter sp.]
MQKRVTNNVFTISKKLAEEKKFEKEILRKNIKNGDIGKYTIFDRGQYLIYRIIHLDRIGLVAVGLT